MAVEIIDVNSMLANSYEPKRSHRWIIGVDRRDLDAFTAKSWARPNFTIDEVVIDYINEKRYLAGKFSPQTFNLVLYDPIAPSEAQKVMEWIDLHHEQLTGRGGYASIYKKDLYLKMLDPAGAVTETWEMRGCWINGADFGPLDYASAEAMTCSLTLRYDKAILIS